MTSGILRGLALFSMRRFKTVFLVFGVLCVLSLLAITRMRFDTDVLNLLPREDPVVQSFLETLEEFGTIDFLLITLRIPEDEVLAPYQTFADELGAELQTLPEIEGLDYRIGEIEELLEDFFPKAVLFLDEEGRQRFVERVSDEGIRQRVEETRRRLRTPQGIALKRLLTLDPLGFSEIFLDRLETSRGGLKVDWTSGYFLSRDHTLLLMLAEPVKPPQDVEFCLQLVEAIEGAVARVEARWPEIAGVEGDDLEGVLLDDELPEPPTVALGGGYLTALDDATFILSDVIKNIITSAVGVLLLFLLAFRRFGPLLYACVPLACGLILTFGFAAVTLGSLSSATSGTAALLIGLGIDFVIVSYGRFVEERKRGGDLEKAVATMAICSGRAVLVGAVTTAATFYAFMVTDFRGLWEMGFLTGTGILFCMISVLMLLPALFAWHERRHDKLATQPNFYLHSFGTNWLMRFCIDHPKTVLTIGLVSSLAAGGLASRLHFENNMMAMRPEGNRGIEVAAEVSETFGSGFNYMMLAVSGEDAQEVLELTDRAAEEAEALTREGVLYKVDSIAALIPSLQRQQEALDWLAEERRSDPDDEAGGKRAALDPDRIRDSFRRALDDEGLRYEPFRPGFELLEQAMASNRALGLADFEESEDGRRLVGRYVQPTAKGWKSVVYLYPPENQWRREPPPQAVALAERLGPQVVLTGSNVINQRLRKRVRRDAWLAAILGLVLVTVLIYVDFRRVRDTLGAMTPLLVGILWMLGAMVVFGIDLNFMNIFVSTMIIGIGVDYGLHILHRYREIDYAPREEFESGILETGKAIVVASLSTICGFGSLSLSHYPGLRSTGYVAILGALATALVAITLLPAWFTIRRRRKGLG